MNYYNKLPTWVHTRSVAGKSGFIEKVKVYLSALYSGDPEEAQRINWQVSSLELSDKEEAVLGYMREHPFHRDGLRFKGEFTRSLRGSSMGQGAPIDPI